MSASKSKTPSVSEPVASAVKKKLPETKEPAAIAPRVRVKAVAAKPESAPDMASATAQPTASPASTQAAEKKKADKTVKVVTEAEAEAAMTAAGAKRGRKPKTGKEAGEADEPDMSDIEEDLAGEPVAEVPEATETAEKVKPLRMKISKAKERALMKEFGLDETVLSEEDLAKRRLRLKALIKLGKTRGYLTHGEISDHLPDKLVDAETLEVVISMLNDMGVAVYEHTPDAETLLLNQNGPTAATEEEAEEGEERTRSLRDR